MTGDSQSPSALIAITGATGFLGSHIASLLVTQGYRVRAAVRPTSDLRWLRGKSIETMQVQLAPAAGTSQVESLAADAEDLDRFLDGAHGIIHCAGLVRAPDEASYLNSNVETTRRLLAAATRQPACRTFVFVSSLAAAGPAPPQMPKREDDPCAPITAYGRSKLAAERLLAADELPLRTAILRPPALYGPRDRAFLPLFRLGQMGWTARFGKNLTALSLVDGRDAAVGAVALLETETATGPYFIDDGRMYSWPEVTAALALACHRRVRSVTIPLNFLKVAARLLGRRRAERTPLLHPDRLADLQAPGWVCSGEKLRLDTGLSAGRDLQRGFRETLDSYYRNGWLHGSG